MMLKACVNPTANSFSHHFDALHGTDPLVQTPELKGNAVGPGGPHQPGMNGVRVGTEAESWGFFAFGHGYQIIYWK